jgi:hypothetical protein
MTKLLIRARSALAVLLWRVFGYKSKPRGTFETALIGKRIELVRRDIVCGRRFDGATAREMPADIERADRWVAIPGQFGLSCSYCGSVDPGFLMAKLREGWRLEGSDKPYKWYLADKNGATVRKFYTVHLPRAQAEGLLQALGDGNVAASLYVRPWLPSLSSGAPFWMTDG